MAGIIPASFIFFASVRSVSGFKSFSFRLVTGFNAMIGLLIPFKSCSLIYAKASSGTWYLIFMLSIGFPAYSSAR